MHKKSFLLIGLLGVMLILSFSIVNSQQDPQAIPLTFGFYGPADSSGALGLQVAVDEINDLGTFTGADGVPYRLEAIISEDLNALSGATVILALPHDEPTLEEPLTLAQPVILLSSYHDLALPDVGATLFRGMTDDGQLYRALADFAVRFNTLERLVIIGDTEIYGEDFNDFATAISQVAGEREIIAQQISADLPTLDQINEAVGLSPQVIVYRGTLDNGAAVLDVLASTGWTGVFVYDHAYEAAQAGLLNVPSGIQVIGLTSWSNGSDDALSQLFQQAYTSRTGQLPDAVAVAAYDLTWAIRLVVERVGGDSARLTAELPNIESFRTTQGRVNPAVYGGNDLLRSAVVYQLHPLGGMQVLARYDAGALVVDDQSTTAALPTQAPLPSATPSGPVVVVTANGLNIRSGPGFEYARIGRLAQGDTVGVVGTVPDYSWFYIQASNGLGWVKAEFVQLFNPLGGVTGIPQVPIPPTPTVGATFTPESPADLVIDSVTLSPARVVTGQPFNATIMIRNAGGTDAPAFAVAVNWQPGNVATTGNVPFLPVFESTSLVIQAVVTGTGAQSTTVTVDSGNAVTESNEANNTFVVNYVVDAQPIEEKTVTVGIGQHNWAGTLPDFDWTGAAPITAMNGGFLGQIIGLDFNNITTSDLTAAKITGPDITSLAAGTVFGLRTGEGHCGVFRIDSVVGSALTISYRMYDVLSCAG